MGKYPISITILMKICENDPEKIKKAMEYLTKVVPDGNTNTTTPGMENQQRLDSQTMN